MTRTSTPSFREVDQLRCPENRQRLRLLEGEELDEINRQIRRGARVEGGGEPVEHSLEAALIREDGAFVYPVRDGLPNLLLEDRIAIDAS